MIIERRFTGVAVKSVVAAVLLLRLLIPMLQSVSLPETREMEEVWLEYISWGISFAVFQGKCMYM